MNYDHRMMRPILDSTRMWECPGCGHRKQTTNPKTVSVTHPCPEHGGVSVPLQLADRHGIIGEVHDIALVEREDYIGDEVVPHGGTMAVHARRPDGSHDTIMFVGTALVDARGEDV